MAGAAEGTVGTAMLGGGGAANLLPAPLGSLIELLRPPTLPGPRGMPLTPASCASAIEGAARLPTIVSAKNTDLPNIEPLPSGGDNQSAVRPFHSRPAGIEALFQALPAIRIIVLQGCGLRGMRGDALRVAGLEHEGHGAGQLHRLQLGIAGVIEGFAVRAMRQHHVVQADAARRKALRFGIVDAVDQPHKLR